MKLPKFMILKGQTFWASKTIPPKLRPFIGKTHVMVRLGTDAKRATENLASAIHYCDTVIQNARNESVKPDLVDLALASRDEDEAGISDAADHFEKSLGFDAAKQYYDIATGLKTPVMAYVPGWNKTSPGSKRTLDRRTKSIKKLASWLADRGILSMDKVTRKVVAEYVESLVDEGLLPTTANIALTNYAAYWRYCVRSGGISENPWDGVKIRDKRGRVKRRPVTEAELQKLIQYATKSDLMLDVIRTLALSGLRVAECAALKVSDILQPPQFNITSAKTPSGIRAVPVHRDLQDMISRRCQGKGPSELVFHELTHKNPGSQLATAGSGWFKDAGLSDKAAGRQSLISLHSLRHRAAGCMEQAGVPESVMAFVLGHERKSVTLGVYSRSGPGLEALTEAINKIMI